MEMRKGDITHHPHFNFQSKSYSHPPGSAVTISKELSDHQELLEAFPFQLSPEDAINQHTEKKRKKKKILKLL